ncbi:MAG: hypothetical protein U0802_21180 [Candidatus Binatia bacterium]
MPKPALFTSTSISAARAPRSLPPEWKAPPGVPRSPGIAVAVTACAADSRFATSSSAAAERAVSTRL